MLCPCRWEGIQGPCWRSRSRPPRPWRPSRLQRYLTRQLDKYLEATLCCFLTCNRSYVSITFFANYFENFNQEPLQCAGVCIQRCERLHLGSLKEDVPEDLALCSSSNRLAGEPSRTQERFRGTPWTPRLPRCNGPGRCRWDLWSSRSVRGSGLQHLRSGAAQRARPGEETGWLQDLKSSNRKWKVVTWSGEQHYIGP